MLHAVELFSQREPCLCEIRYQIDRDCQDANGLSVFTELTKRQAQLVMREDQLGRGLRQWFQDRSGAGKISLAPQRRSQQQQSANMAWMLDQECSRAGFRRSRI